MKKLKNFVFATIVCAAGYTPTVKGQTAVGLRSDVMNYVAASQTKSQWCWAACIQMILKYHGIDLSQSQIVARSFGATVDRPGSPEIISANLNGWGLAAGGRSYAVASGPLSSPTIAAALVGELRAGHPVFIGYNTGTSGHAVVCTSVEYVGTASFPEITSITVRDPWPSDENIQNRGRKTWSGRDLQSRIMFALMIRVISRNQGGDPIPPPRPVPPRPKPDVEDTELAEEIEELQERIEDLEDRVERTKIGIEKRRRDGRPHITELIPDLLDMQRGEERELSRAKTELARKRQGL